TPKRPLKMWLLFLLFLPGLIPIIIGAASAFMSRSAIENAVVTQGKVERVYKQVKRDLEGKVERDWLSASFNTADGKSMTVEAEVFSTVFVSAGDLVTVRYDARAPTKARISAGFFAEPYHVVFLVLFGAIWLVIPTAILALVLRARMKAQG